MTVAWACLIFNFSTSTYGPSFSIGFVHLILEYLRITVSPGGFTALHHLIRKLAHPAEYAIFAMLLYGSSSAYEPFAWRPRRALWCFLFAAAYSLTDEFHQRFVPGRTPALADCGIDSLGSALGMLIFYLDNRIFPGSKTPPSSRPPGKSNIFQWLCSRLNFGE